MVPTLEAAQLLYAAGQDAAAADMLTALDAAGAADADALHLLGLALNRLDRAQEAAPVLERAVARSPSNNSMRADLADAYVKMGNSDGAIEQLRIVNANVFGHSSTRRLVVLLVQRGETLAAANRHADAAAVLWEAAGIDSTAPGLLSLLGVSLTRLGSHAHAEQVLRQARSFYPDSADVAINLAGVLDTLNQPEEGETLCRAALTRACESAEAWTNLGATLRSQGRLAESAQAAQRALALQPALMPALANLGTLHSANCDFDESAACYRRALRAAPDDPLPPFLFACDRLKAGDWETGWEYYEQRGRQFAHQPPWPSIEELPRWSDGDPAGRRILLECEQGLGDSLHFFRYARLLADRGAHVGVLTHPPLTRLFRLSDPRLAVMPYGEEIKREEWDYGLPLMSLPHRFGARPDSVPAAPPYLSVDPADAARWKTRLEPLAGLKVGLVWAGAPRPDLPVANGIDRRRSMHLSTLAPLAAVGGVDFVNLQLGEPAAQLADAPFPVHDWSADFGDMADTAALISQLDLVVTVDTALAHTAGGLDMPVLTLSRYDGCWRWLSGRDDTPWYPKMRLFRQSRWADWSAPVADLVVWLKAWAANGGGSAPQGGGIAAQL